MCAASSGVDCLQVLLKVTDVEMEICLVGIQWLQILISDVFFFLFLDASQYTCCLHPVLTARLSVCDILGKWKGMSLPLVLPSIHVSSVCTTCLAKLKIKHT